MKILYICHRFPFPPRRGGKIRPFNMIRHLTGLGHSVTVCSLVRSEDEAAEGGGIAPHCERFVMGRVSNSRQTLRMIAFLPLRTPSSMGFFYSSVLAVILRQALHPEASDLIFVHCSSITPYT